MLQKFSYYPLNNLRKKIGSARLRSVVLGPNNTKIGPNNTKIGPIGPNKKKPDQRA